MLQFTKKEQRKIIFSALMNGRMLSMCYDLERAVFKRIGRIIDYRKDGLPSDWITGFTHNNYLQYYSNNSVVQERADEVYWDNQTIAGRWRRFKFLVYLHKELM